MGRRGLPEMHQCDLRIRGLHVPGARGLACHVDRLENGSIPLVGSSNKMTFGSVSSFRSFGWVSECTSDDVSFAFNPRSRSVRIVSKSWRMQSITVGSSAGWTTSVLRQSTTTESDLVPGRPNGESAWPSISTKYGSFVSGPWLFMTAGVQLMSGVV